MKKTLLSFLMICVLAASFSTLAIAEDVYITKYGKKYHKEGSRFIKDREVERIDRKKAEELGYEPSSDFLEEDAEAEKK